MSGIWFPHCSTAHFITLENRRKKRIRSLMEQLEYNIRKFNVDWKCIMMSKQIGLRFHSFSLIITSTCRICTVLTIPKPRGGVLTTNCPIWIWRKVRWLGNTRDTFFPIWWKNWEINYDNVFVELDNYLDKIFNLGKWQAFYSLKTKSIAFSFKNLFYVK